jgi:hypothetical protein
MKVFWAGVLAALGLYLGIAGGLALVSGGGALIVALALMLLVASVWLLVLAALVFRQRRAAVTVATPPPQRTLWQRLTLMLIGVFALAVGGKALLTGHFESSRSSRDVERSERPGHFWQIVGVYLVGGGVCLFLGLQPTPGGRRSRVLPKPRRASEGSAE